MLSAELQERQAFEMIARANYREGREEGISSIVDLNNWLYDQSRDEDVKKATKDPEYLKQLLEEYSKEHGN